jgi:hypothetical protein
MRRLEHVRPLHAQTDQRVHIEEAPVAQLLAGRAPIGQPVQLLIQQCIQGIAVAVQLVHCAVNRRNHVRLVLAKPSQQAVDHGFITVPGLADFKIGRLRRRQAQEAVRNEIQCVVFCEIRRLRKDNRQRPWSHREQIVAITHLEAFHLVLNIDLPRAQYAPILVAQHRNQHFILQLGLGRVPIDVEPCGKAAGRAILKHIPPVTVFAPDGHVVGHNIQHLAQPQFAQPQAKSLVSVFATQLFIDPLVVDDIVAVHAA